MKPSIFLLALAVITITSCTSAYKTGQTPDDVYFSPQKSQSEYVATNNREEDPGYYNGNDYYGDRYLRMKVQNRYQWSDLDDYYYTDRYSYGGFGGYSYYNSGLYMNNPWNPVSYWNYYYNPYYSSFYNPYYSPIFVIGNKGNGVGNNYTVTNRPRTFNLNTYNSNQLTNGNYTNRRFDFNSAPNNVNNNNYNNNYRNSRTNAGGFLRNAFGSGNNNNSNNTNDNSRSYNNTNNNSSSSGGRSSGGSSSGSSSSSSGSSAPVRKF